MGEEEGSGLPKVQKELADHSPLTAPNLRKPIPSAQLDRPRHDSCCLEAAPASQVVQGEVGQGKTAEQTAPRDGWEVGQQRQRLCGLF